MSEQGLEPSTESPHKPEECLKKGFGDGSPQAAGVCPPHLSCSGSFLTSGDQHWGCSGDHSQPASPALLLVYPWLRGSLSCSAQAPITARGVC